MIIQDKDGNDVEVFSAEEMTAKAAEIEAAAAEKVRLELEAKHKAELEEKDNHHKTKLDEFMQGKKGVDKDKEEAQAKLDEALRIANEAKQSVESAKVEKNTAIKNFWINQTVGTDDGLTKQLMDAYEMINLEIKDETDIAKRVGLAANMIGINPIQTPNISFAGGVPPMTSPVERKNEADYDTFKNELGLKLPAAKTN